MESLLASFERLCRDRPDGFALWSRGERRCLSFAQLQQGARSWQQALAGLGGEAVAVATGNCTDFILLVLALFQAGTPVATLDGTLSAAEKEGLCRRLGIRHLLHRDLALPGDDLGGVLWTRFEDLEGTVPPTGTALIKVTSGSTGQAQGICLGDLADAGAQGLLAEGMELKPSDRVLIAIPLSHSYGFDNGLLSLLAIGTPLVLEPGYYPTPLLAALRAGEITLFPAVPPIIRALGETEWPAELPLARVICAGGHHRRRPGGSSGRHHSRPRGDPRPYPGA